MDEKESLYGGVSISSLIIDPGSLTTKLGTSGCLSPSHLLPTHYAQIEKLASDTHEPSNEIKWSLFDPKDEVRRLIENSNIKDFSLFCNQLEEIFVETLRNDTATEKLLQNMPTILVEQIPYTLAARNETATYFFETLGAPAFYLAKGAALAAISAGKTTAAVLDLGHDLTKSAIVVDGYQLRTGFKTANVSGSFLDQQFLEAIVQKSGESKKDMFGECSDSYFCFSSRKFARDIKQDSFLQTFAETSAETKEYTMPDNKTVFLLSKKDTKPVFASLFEPFVLNGENETTFSGVPSLLLESVVESDVDVRKDLYNSVVVVGGTATVRNFRTTFVEELENKAADLSSLIKIKVSHSEAYDEVAYGSWVGGSILACLGTFQKMWVAKSEFEEIGSKALQRKFY